MKLASKISLITGVIAIGFCGSTNLLYAQAKKATVKKPAAGNTAGFKKIKGIEYKFIKDVPGTNAAMGEIVEFHILGKAGDSTITDSRAQQGGNPAADKVQDIPKSGMVQSVFPFLSKGDSVWVRISCDTILATIPAEQQKNLPPFIAKGKKLDFYISVVGIKSMEAYSAEMQEKQNKMQQEMMANAGKQGQIDDSILQAYFKKNNIQATKTESGLYYTILKEGTGPRAKPGVTASMKYLGTTTDGRKFDGNMDDNFEMSSGRAVFSFGLGAGQVIKGWDEGVQLLNKGCRAVLYLPSGLAYGPQSPTPAIPPNSVLIFKVELTDMTDEK